MQVYKLHVGFMLQCVTAGAFRPFSECDVNGDIYIYIEVLYYATNRPTKICIPFFFFYNFSIFPTSSTSSSCQITTHKHVHKTIYKWSKSDVNDVLYVKGGSECENVRHHVHKTIARISFLEYNASVQWHAMHARPNLHIAGIWCLFFFFFFFFLSC